MKYFLTFISCFSLCILSGCWDESPIDERGFVIGSALDTSDNSQNGLYDITLTSQFVIPDKLSNPSQGQGGGEQSAFKNISVSGQSSFQISRNMLSLTSLIPNYEHLKILVISTDIAEESELFSSVVDGFIRDHEMRRGIKVMVAEGAAKEILEVKSDTEQLPSRLIDTIMENNVKSLELIEPVRVGELHRYLLNESSYVLPLLSLSDDGYIQYDSIAVFNGKADQKVGSLTGDDIKGLNLIRGNVTNGIILFYIDGHPMVYEINTASSSVNINVVNPDDIQVTVSVDTEGSIAEMFGSRTLLDQSYIHKIESQINKRIEQIITTTIRKGQEELQVDIFGFRNILRQKHYNDWEKIENNWEEGEQIFSNNTTVEVSSDAIVRNIGASDKAKDQ
ncbi:Ger(x)C family spore germination protein [Gracilibacillus salinarum]|uniref:Ger(X)C family spore germination protein n=1 Tax=Gracilibacillus salinarum TaxID=2932255 RepID=A0ABY4GKQ8_9BACI|nr:Ger(x)C family spore germination protein [Gracilibacillus salinarum]UOQ84783.1 Ger(x)C family spore germination protein [Gracilibacillus salinarum]